MCKTQQTVLTEDNKVIKLSHTLKDHVSARIDENGVKTEKLWLKQGSRGLTAKVLKEKGFW